MAGKLEAEAASAVEGSNGVEGIVLGGPFGETGGGAASEGGFGTLGGTPRTEGGFGGDGGIAPGGLGAAGGVDKPDIEGTLGAIDGVGGGFGIGGGAPGGPGATGGWPLGDSPPAGADSGAIGFWTGFGGRLIIAVSRGLDASG